MQKHRRFIPRVSHRSFGCEYTHRSILSIIIGSIIDESTANTDFGSFFSTMFSILFNTQRLVAINLVELAHVIHILFTTFFFVHTSEEWYFTYN
jgi:hypothetical protein